MLQDAEYRTKLVNAYEATGDYYDTTYRSPQDWALASPDGLVDLYSFASQVATQFGEPVNSLVNNELLPLLDTAVTARYAQDGSPWFADTNPKPTWTFGGKGLSLYADLVGTQIDDQIFISWHAPFYANIDNLDPPPYEFMQSGYQGVTWGSLFGSFWQDTNNLQLDAYLPDFPPIPAELSCEDAEIRPGEAITVDVVASGVNVYGIEANCTAEQSILSGPAVTLGDFFDPSSRSVGMNQIDESTASWAGLISQQNPAPPVSDEAILATLTYTGTTPGSSQITCNPLFSNRDGFAIPAQAAACTITVLAPNSNTISSHVEYQGRLDHTAINVTMTHTTSGSSQTSGTDDKGYFESDPLEVGNYQVKADADLYLPTCETTDLTSDEPTILPSTALSGGDMNDDDTINIGDATLLGANLDSVAAEADINADGTVNVQGYNIFQAMIRAVFR